MDAARNIAQVCKEAGVSRLIHVSCLNANPGSSSAFLKAKVGVEERGGRMSVLQ